MKEKKEKEGETYKSIYQIWDTLPVWPFVKKGKDCQRRETTSPENEKPTTSSNCVYGSPYLWNDLVLFKHTKS